MSAASPSNDCAVKPKNLPRPQQVSVNGTAIPRADISREVQNHPAAKPVDAWLAAARALVIRQLLLQAARRAGLTPAPITDAKGRRETDEEALIRQVVAAEVVAEPVDDTICRRVYDSNRSQFRSGDLFEARHILLPAADTAARQAAMKLAESIIETVSNDPALFDALAETHSACPSATTGGNLGQIGEGQTVTEFEAALGRAPVGRVAPRPIETRYGIHVVFVERRIDGHDLPFETVRDRIAAWLRERAWRTAVRRYIARLVGEATITGVSFDADPYGP